MQQKLSTSLEENQKYFGRILRTDKNFDIISRTTMVADRKAVYYFVDGFLKESIVEKLLEFFYSVTPEDLPEDSEELSKDAMPYVEVELLEDCEQITTQILSGVMCLFIDGYSRCFAMDVVPIRCEVSKSRTKTKYCEDQGMVLWKPSYPIQH